MSQEIKIKTLNLGSNSYFKTTKNHIAYIGIEIEGYWYNSHPDLKHDGSVQGFDVESKDCDGSCRDHCECFDQCECRDCAYCNNCRNDYNYCECDSCYYCDDCDNQLDDCDCEIVKICKNKNCELINRCVDCLDNFKNLQNISYNCFHGSGVYYNCAGDCDCECNCQCCCQNCIGEVSSPKLKINEVDNWINENYCDESNVSTGMHIHLSFLNDRQDYHKIATRKFYDHFITEITNWAKKRGINENYRFWKRLEGTQYSMNVFDCDNQLEHNGNRYTHVNYCYYKFAENGKNGTVEIRLAPVFNDKNISIEYIHKIIDIFNTYLENTKTTVFKFSKNIHINSGYNFRLDLKIQHDSNGLEILAKSSKFEKLYFPSIDIHNIEIIKMQNHKVKFYHDMINLIKQENNFTSTQIFDHENNRYMPNMIFLKLANLSSGKKVFINGLFTEKMIYKYIQDLYDNLDLFVREYC